jgi:hypothetical protein
MKQKAINHEILLVTDSNFNSRQFSKRDGNNEESKNNSAIEELEKACWDGMLNELLPELAGYSSRSNKNFIWNIASGSHSLYISIGPCPMPGKNETSIDPYFFLTDTLKN